MKNPPRICIYTKDVMRITGRGERYSRSLLNKVRISCSKNEGHMISVYEFCKYTGLDIEQVKGFLID